MNFNKWLRLLLQQTLPEWRDHYISYKLLKKRIKLIEAAKNTRNEDENCCWNGGVSPEGIPLKVLEENEVGFIPLLNAELHKLNRFIEEKSKDCHIRLQVLKGRIEKMSSTTQGNANSSCVKEQEEIILLGKDLVNFHGELILLENYCVWNYTGLRKILKKYDKRILAVLGESYIQWMKIQPCFATEALSKLITECQSIVQSFFYSFLYGDKNGITEMLHREDEQVYKSSIAALEILREMMAISSAYNDDD